MSWPRGSNISPVRIQSIFGEEMRAPLHHGRAVEPRPAAGDEAHRIAAGVAVDAEEGMARHGGLRQKRCGEKGVRSIGRSLPEHEVADQAAGGRRLRQAEMAVAEGVEDVRRVARAGR